MPLNIHKNENTSFRKNLIFTAALVLLLFYGATVFGLSVLLVALVAILGSLAVDVLFWKTRSIAITSGALITPLLLTLLLPPTIPLWMAVVGSVFGNFFAKGIFGGEGKYIFHPAVVGILFLTISFPVEMNTQWLNPETGLIQAFKPIHSVQYFPFPTSVYTANELLLGLTPGSIGETFRLGIVVLGVILIALRIIDWKPVVGFLGSFVVLSLVFNLFSGPRDVMFSLITGTVLFAAVFLVSDPVVAPRHPIAKFLYGFGLALITILIRIYAAFPEGIVFALIIMSAVSPMLDTFFVKEGEPS